MGNNGGVGFFGIVMAIIVAVIILCFFWWTMYKPHGARHKILDVFLCALTVLLYLLNNVYFKKATFGTAYLFFTGHFNDLICPLLFLSYTNLLLNFVNRRVSGLIGIILLCFLCGFIWEFIAPVLKKDSVADICDLLCYCIGGGMYWSIHKLLNLIHKF